MGRSRPVYNEIRALRTQLDEAAAVKKSRAASERLLVMLSDPDVRRRLAAEATPDNLPPGRSLTAIRRVALSEMWRALIQSAVTSVHLIARRGKSKLTNQDVRFPFKLLELCDKPDEVFDEATCKLGREQTKLLCSYCMTMLDDEQTLLIDGAEKTLLTMLAYICSRREFVAYFRPEQHISAILEEVEKRLITSDGEDESSFPPEIVKIAAKVFGNLLATCQDLGIGLHLILPGTIKLVATWCQQNEEERSFLEETVYLLSGASILLRSDPDLAIAPLSRHGRPILKLVKRSLGNLDLQKASKPYVAALTEYLLRYL
jgi:hypothetical protein